MAKASITYVGNAEGVSAWGYDFSGSDKPFETEDEAIIAKARSNPSFDVKGGPKDESGKEQPVVKQPAVSARERGATAKAAGKPRNVPPAYRGKADEKEWLAGFDTPAEPTSGSYPHRPAAEEAAAQPDTKKAG